MTLLTFLLQADTAAALDQAAQTVAVKQQASMSLIDMTIKGGWLMIPLFILSILTIYIFGVKWYTIRKASKLNPNFMNDIKDLIELVKTTVKKEMHIDLKVEQEFVNWE